jgi:competence protein ComEC
LRSVIGASGILLFLILAGGGSSAMRAGIMAGILIYSRSRGKTYNALWALTIATTVLIIISPLSLRYDVGFHLSVLATFGLIAFQRPISVFLIRKHLYKWFIEILSTTVSATIMTLPYIAYSMGIFSILGIIANIIVVPLLPPLMLFSFLVGILGNNILFLTKIFSFITNTLSNIILYTINYLGSISFAALYVEKIPLVLVSSIYIFLFYKGLRLLTKDS